MVPEHAALSGKSFGKSFGKSRRRLQKHVQDKECTRDDRIVCMDLPAARGHVNLDSIPVPLVGEVGDADGIAWDGGRRPVVGAEFCRRETYKVRLHCKYKR